MKKQYQLILTILIILSLFLLSKELFLKPDKQNTIDNQSKSKIPANYSSEMLGTYRIEDLTINVSICLKSKLIYTQKIALIIENNHNKTLEWGSYYEAEKLENQYWIKQNPPWDAWTMELYRLPPEKISGMSFRTDWLDPGIYRITKYVNIEGKRDIPNRGIAIRFIIEKTDTPINTSKSPCWTSYTIDFSQYVEPESFDELYQDILKFTKYRDFFIEYYDTILGTRIESYNEFMEYINNTSCERLFLLNRSNYFGAIVWFNGNPRTWFKVLDEVNDEKADDTQNVTMGILWDTEPKILLDKPAPSAWWLEGYMDGEPTLDVLDPSIRLRRALDRNESVVVENYCQVYVNDYNNTIFVVSKSLDVNVTDAFLDIMKPGPEVSVKFRRGYASWVELEAWEAAIWGEIENIEASGVELCCFGKSENATLRIGIINITMDDVQVILTILEGKVPPGVIIFEPGYQSISIN
jgi:Bacterial Ig-like domain